MENNTDDFEQRNDIPDTSVSEVLIGTSNNLTLEKYKVKLNFYKWILGTFCIALITIVINYSFNDRSVGMNELSVYEKYATEVLVLNENPKKKRMLAQFFGNAAPSYFIRRQWRKYFLEVDKEYKQYVRANDSLLKRYKQLLSIPKATLTEADKFDMDFIKKSLNSNYTQESTPIELPENNIYSNTNSRKDRIRLAIEYENRGFKALLDKNYINAKNAFYQSYKLFPTLHNVNEIYDTLQMNEIKTKQDWNKVYNLILKRYSWGMPEEMQSEMKLVLNSADN